MELVEFILARLDEDAQAADALDSSIECTASRAVLALADRQRDDIDAKRQLIEDIISDRHRVVEDCWYTCPAATEERDGGESCHEDANGQCDCGRDKRVERRLRLLAMPYADHPDWREEWRRDG